MYERNGICCITKKLMENQHSYKHEDLAYYSTEYMKDMGVIEFGFLKYPDWSEISDTEYESRISWLIRFVKHAFISAFNETYDIDLEAPPLKRIMAIISSIDKLQSTKYAIYFGFAFGKEMLKDMVKNTYYMMVAAFVDPSIGPLQVIGSYNSSKFRFVCTVTEDPKVHEKVAEAIEHVTKLCFKPDKCFISNTNEVIVIFTKVV